jgi:glutaredoxin|nr:MAG TPA: glutaredoxin-like protein [Caudoviricetes sp.]
MRKFTVYTKPNCVQCTATKRWLDRRQVPYEETAVDESPAILKEAQRAGISQAPIVRLSDQDEVTLTMWGGFNPTLLGKYTQ